jgi:hypothetical protein
MAFKYITTDGQNKIGVPDADVTQAGITAITQASAEASAGTIVRAKNGAGEIVGVLLGKKTISMSVSGYSSVKEGAKLGEVLRVGAVDGIVTSSSIEATSEDFTKFSAEGRAINGGVA